MNFKQGNTYNLKIPVKMNGEPLDIDEVSKVVFKFNDIQKEFGTGDVSYDSEENYFVVNFSQEDTLKLKKEVKYEVAIKFKDDSVKRSIVKTTSTLYTIIEEEI